ncbi:hypothetical protein AB0K09_02875 [Streptomyces sp. NPDC049577]|uniref:hypothetical protein n=1 Tax=Streptomyces sp. NPDC049577 TaxID=3155153 RepID=UPI003432B677
MSSPPLRFRDPQKTKYDFLGLILVRCPACAGPARVVRSPGDQGPSLFVPRRLTCGGCGTARRWAGNVVPLHRAGGGAVREPYFGAPLWLQTETRHGWLWAYNPEHLELVRRFVQASLRERAPWYEHGRKMTVVGRLPAWVKRAKNREEILRAIGRMPDVTPGARRG